MAALDQFAVQRQRAQQDANVQSQQSSDALNRRFASLGNLNSGAQIKIQNQQQGQINKQLADTNQGIDASEATENERKAEITQGQQFQTSERVGSQTFAAQQAAQAQGQQQSQFAQTFGLQSEAQKSQEAYQNKTFNQTKSDNAANRALATSQFNQTLNFNKGNASTAQSQADRNYDLEREAQTFNEGIAKDAAKPTGLAAGLSSGLGDIGKAFSSIGSWKSPW